MDNNNLKVRFVGYAGDGQLKAALKSRKNPIELETFYNAVNQTTTGGCSCCKQDAKVYAIYVVGIPQINNSTISLCSECASQLPEPLTIISIDSNGAPPTLIQKYK
jgi:hypothetical protein